jgi:IS4 transposase
LFVVWVIGWAVAVQVSMSMEEKERKKLKKGGRRFFYIPK